MCRLSPDTWERTSLTFRRQAKEAYLGKAGGEKQSEAGPLWPTRCLVWIKKKKKGSSSRHYSICQKLVIIYGFLLHQNMLLPPAGKYHNRWHHSPLFWVPFSLDVWLEQIITCTTLCGCQKHPVMTESHKCPGCGHFQCGREFRENKQQKYFLV